MGPWGGFVTGLAESIEFILTPAVIVFFIGSYLGSIFGTGPELQPLWWVGGDDHLGQGVHEGQRRSRAVQRILRASI
jgi:hypothetical protein